MPTYDYQCIHCGTQFETRHAIDARRPQCPVCGEDVRQLILSPPAAHGYMARGRELAMQSLQPKAGQEQPRHGPRCSCCNHRDP